MPTPWLELHAVEAYLGPRRVLQDLSLELHQGEHTVLLGPNGAGKSALVQLIGRAIHPVVRPGSRLRLFGQERITLWELRRRMGLVSQSQQESYRGGVRAADVVLSGFHGSVGIGPSQRVSAAERERVAALMEELQLADLAACPFRELSDGQRRRLLLARALVHEPSVLVLDEPTNGLDLRARHQLLSLLRRRAQAGTTLLMITHQIEAILPEMQRCVFLRNGSVVGDGPSATLLQPGPLSDLFDTPLQVVRAGGWHQVLPA